MWGDEVVDPVPMDPKVEALCETCHLVHNRFLDHCPDCELFGSSRGGVAEQLKRIVRQRRTSLIRRAQDASRLRRVAA